MAEGASDALDRWLWTLRGPDDSETTIVRTVREAYLIVRKNVFAILVRCTLSAFYLCNFRQYGHDS